MGPEMATLVEVRASSARNFATPGPIHGLATRLAHLHPPTSLILFLAFAARKVPHKTLLDHLPLWEK